MGACTVMLAAIVGLGACGAPEVNGSALVLNMQPAPPRFVGAYDFDLLGPVRGQSCANRSDGSAQASTYWLRSAGLDQLASDPLTTRAIGAAAFDAMKNSPSADTLVILRVVTEGHGPEQVCATVYARGVRLMKAGTTNRTSATKEDVHDE